MAVCLLKPAKASSTPSISPAGTLAGRPRPWRERLYMVANTELSMPAARQGSATATQLLEHALKQNPTVLQSLLAKCQAPPGAGAQGAALRC